MWLLITSQSINPFPGLVISRRSGTVRKEPVSGVVVVRSRVDGGGAGGGSGGVVVVWVVEVVFVVVVVVVV